MQHPVERIYRIKNRPKCTYIQNTANYYLRLFSNHIHTYIQTYIHTTIMYLYMHIQIHTLTWTALPYLVAILKLICSVPRLRFLKHALQEINRRIPYARTRIRTLAHLNDSCEDTLITNSCKPIGFLSSVLL